MEGYPEERRRPLPVRRNFVFRDPPFLKADKPALRNAYLARRLDAIDAIIGGPDGIPALGRLATKDGPAFAVTHLPLADWGLALGGEKELAARLAAARAAPEEAAFALAFADEKAAAIFREGAERIFGRFDKVVSDLRISPALHWTPGRGEGDDFATFEDARALVRADALAAKGLDGKGVKVVVIDQGVAAGRLLDPSRFAGGWSKAGGPQPGTATGTNTHGTMIARTIQALAPRALIFDCPLIPPRILGNLPAFLSDAFGAIGAIARDIRLLGMLDPRFAGRWVLVNAWSIYDARGETVPGEYTKNPYHWVACAIDAAAPHAAIVFAAGNCGEFGPDPRCAPRVIGPGRSILGANSLDSVLTVGAVRADGIWAGYSSQGPGQFAQYLGHPQQKPDLVAPSHFRTPEAPYPRAGGSSAACAVAAGAVAALRTGWHDSVVPNDALFGHLRKAARQMDGSAGWNLRTGHGVLDCAATIAGLP
ncbi:S8 family serine peptidase [Roseomonas sp. PWR1]|uniref:S8 family serine peptidase n=1 Tax=Roseomonas nitratireducens TaxID=2820810 RepID=A0ABS4AV57_9PROT|nr:S8 family serine peptidase [Neoroseomonas nitratireducens]MBP0465240.1 S8 family serine peptidase [Neoroseomonas nitratireducens]